MLFLRRSGKALDASNSTEIPELMKFQFSKVSYRARLSSLVHIDHQRCGPLSPTKGRGVPPRWRTGLGSCIETPKTAARRKSRAATSKTAGSFLAIGPIGVKSSPEAPRFLIVDVVYDRTSQGEDSGLLTRPVLEHARLVSLGVRNNVARHLPIRSLALCRRNVPRRANAALCWTYPPIHPSVVCFPDMIPTWCKRIFNGLWL